MSPQLDTKTTGPATSTPRNTKSDDLKTPIKRARDEFEADASPSAKKIKLNPEPEAEHGDGDEIPDDFSEAHSLTSPKSIASTSPKFEGGYDALKSFNGQVYKGMAIGGSHTWNYDPGIWKETKVEPDLWNIDFETTKRRAKNAPSNSGAPVGTEYHWLIVSHQKVRKIDANTYETHLVGAKYKLAHKNANSTSWSVNTVKAQREREIELLEDAIRRIKGLPPVTNTEKVKPKSHEKGQQSLDKLFGKQSNTNKTTDTSPKRKHDPGETENQPVKS